MSRTALLEAVRKLDLDRVRRLLLSKPDLVGATDREGRGLLHLACSADPAKCRVAPRDQARMVDLLLDAGLEIDQPVGRDACTPLFFAVARARNLALAKRLVERGADVKAAPGGGLFAAGWWEDIGILKFLMRAGADVDVVVGVTPFLACWCWKRLEAAKCLARNGADVDYKDSDGRTALHHGMEKQFDPVHLAWLVKHGASPDIKNAKGTSARMMAARKRDRRYLAALDAAPARR